MAAAGSPVSVGLHPRNLAVADLNGDGHLNLAAPGDHVNAVRTLLGTGTGTLTLHAAANFPVGLSPNGIAAGDLDGDNTPDLVVANFIDAAVSIALGDGSGTITPSRR